MKKWMGILMAAVLLVAALSILPVHGEAGLYDNVIRLHVLANSDSTADQALKLRVRDAVLEESRLVLQGASTREEAEARLSAALPQIKAAAEAAVAAAGVRAPVSVTLTPERYPTREYESLAFPAGEYLSLRVMLGEAEGANWWCVLFPPLCLSAATDEKSAETACLSAGLSEEQYRLIADADTNAKYKLRFKLLEVIEGILG